MCSLRRLPPSSWSTSASGSSGPWAWARLSPAGGEPEKVANLLGSDLLDGLRDSGTMSPAAPNSISPCMELLSDLCSLLLRRLREPLAALCPAGRPGSALAPSSSPLMASSMRSTHAAAQLPLPDPGVDLAADSCRVCLRGPGAPSNTLAPYGGAPPLERVLGRAMEPSLGSGSDLLTDDSAHDPDSERSMSSDTLPPETSFASACCQRAMAGDSRCSRRLSSAPWKYMRMRDTLWKLRLPCDVACCDWRLGPAAAPAPPLRPLLMPLSSDPVRRRRRLAAVASEGARCAASALLWPTVDSADAYAISRLRSESSSATSSASSAIACTSASVK
mmetsp:Transcript_28715/g.84935  ORF Transcript_28715/g.84935 Transcript_28715/m.84935 type:complete len:333 (+) Transcript_28715:366-1364(+)